MATAALVIALTSIGLSLLSAYWSKQAAAYRKETARLRATRLASDPHCVSQSP